MVDEFWPLFRKMQSYAAISSTVKPMVDDHVATLFVRHRTSAGFFKTTMVDNIFAIDLYLRIVTHLRR